MGDKWLEFTGKKIDEIKIDGIGDTVVLQATPETSSRDCNKIGSSRILVDQ